MQQREAEHVRIRYKDIKKTLQDDAALFESNIRKLEEELHRQDLDIDRLQKVTLFLDQKFDHFHKNLDFYVIINFSMHVYELKIFNSVEVFVFLLDKS